MSRPRARYPSPRPSLSGDVRNPARKHDTTRHHTRPDPPRKKTWAAGAKEWKELRTQLEFANGAPSRRDNAAARPAINTCRRSW